MSDRQKLYTSVLLSIVFAFSQIGMAAAQETTPAPLAGTVQSITLEPDAAASPTTVAVTYQEDGTGTVQTVRISVETAASLGLITINNATDPPEIVVNSAAVGQSITIDPATVIAEAEHPVGSKLSDFFGDLLGVDYGTIMGVHEEGTGFGVIAQALWLTNKLGGDSNTFQMIIEAKKTGDYSNLTLPDGTVPTATNWGQFKQETSDKGDKGNLGSVMSGKADKEGSLGGLGGRDLHNMSDAKNNGNGNGNGNGKDNENGNKGGNGKDHHGKP
jgi:hypothetical protein